ncbi:hypothetical protein DPMN_090594 [Dreissena polymorpha]|uniref:Uncharacterized protein n=1 Tax=Dreissena polymorpha TaxID=45954 RepID=A0A9D4QZX5_DREPO|nr:hypothetical protein DPMN_090594 [Dreissena polymorpha]
MQLPDVPVLDEQIINKNIPTPTTNNITLEQIYNQSEREHLLTGDYSSYNTSDSGNSPLVISDDRSEDDVITEKV